MKYLKIAAGVACFAGLIVYGVYEFSNDLGQSIRERKELDSLKKEKLKLEIKHLKSITNTPSTF